MSRLKSQREIIVVEGREFSVYREYDEISGGLCTIYPDFEMNPEFTEAGHPFATAGQESCKYSRAKDSSELLSEDCGGCVWFFRDTSPLDIIGICKCKLLRAEPSENEQTMLDLNG